MKTAGRLPSCGARAGDGYVYNTSVRVGPTSAPSATPQGSKHELNLSILGAGQWHHQRDVEVSIRDYEYFGEEGIDQRWNSNGGMRTNANGEMEEFNMRRNFYNKPSPRSTGITKSQRTSR